MIELKGSGCRYLEMFLQGQGRSWYDVLQTCIELDGSSTRLDLAINDRSGLLDVAELLNKCKREEYVSRFHGHSDNSTTRDSRTGCTLYLGSRNSEFYLCFYGKAFEHHQKHPELAIENAPIKTRLELRLRRARARTVVDNLLAERDPEKTVFSIVNQYVHFLTLSHKVKHDWNLDPRWAAFIGQYRDKLRLSMDPQPMTFEKTKRWLEKQVSGSLKMIDLIDAYTG